MGSCEWLWQLLLATASWQTWAQRWDLMGTSTRLQTAAMSLWGCCSGWALATLAHCKLPPGSQAKQESNHPPPTVQIGFLLVF